MAVLGSWIRYLYALCTMLGIIACACCIFSSCGTDQEAMAVHFISEQYSYQHETHPSLSTGYLAVLTAADEATQSPAQKIVRRYSGDQGDVAVPSASRGSDMLRVSRFCSTLSISCARHHNCLSASPYSYESRLLSPGTLTCRVQRGSAASAVPSCCVQSDKLCLLAQLPSTERPLAFRCM